MRKLRAYTKEDVEFPMTPRQKEGARRRKQSAVKADIKTAQSIKEAYLLAVGNNVDSVDAWIKELAETDKAKAIQMMTKLTEYILPKLSKEEVILAPALDYSKLTDEELETLNTLIEKCKND
jgi:phage gp29-like protein